MKKEERLLQPFLFSINYPMNSDTFDVLLEKHTYGGSAMGRLPDGRAVFVPYGLPGERVRILISNQKKGFAYATLVEVLQPSPDRIEPRCIHFGKCGGCHYQHLPYEKQLQIKSEIVTDSLQRIAKIEHPPVNPTVPSPNQWNYRNHLQFHLTPEGRLGFIASDQISILPVSECHLPEPSINAFWRQLEIGSESGVQRVSLRAGRDEELMIVLESENPEVPELEVEADVSVVHLHQQHPIVLAGQDHLFIQLSDREFRVSAASFFQVNTLMAEKMIPYLLEHLPLSRSVTLLDVYCGVGFFSKFLAGHYKKVVGIEGSPSACEDFVVNLDEFEHVDLYEGDAAQILPSLSSVEFGDLCAIIDPPRSGMEREVLDAIIKIKPMLIAYVSCDPSTLARDTARLLNGGYQLVEVTPFDLFPQTYHIETISIFKL